MKAGRPSSRTRGRSRRANAGDSTKSACAASFATVRARNLPGDASTWRKRAAGSCPPAQKKINAPRPFPTAAVFAATEPACAPVAQLDRAPDYESGGREFKSLRARHSCSLNLGFCRHDCRLGGYRTAAWVRAALSFLSLVTRANSRRSNCMPGSPLTNRAKFSAHSWQTDHRPIMVQRTHHGGERATGNVAALSHGWPNWGEMESRY